MIIAVLLRSHAHHESYPKVKNNNKKKSSNGKNTDSIKTRTHEYNLLIYFYREPDEAPESI